MMTDVLYVARQVILVTPAPMHSVITVMVLVILSRTAQRKFPHHEHLVTTTDHTPNHVMTTAAGTDHSPFITDAARENALTGWSHTANLATAEATATVKGMHPTPNPTTEAASDTHPPTDTLGNTLTGTHCSGTAATHP